MSSELRKRTTTPEDKDKLLTMFAESTPESIRPMATKAVPFVKQVWEGVEKVLPVVLMMYAKALDLWHKLQPYHPDELLPCLAGLAMCFFGGDFPITIATVVAVRTTGSWSQIQESFVTLYTSASNVVDAVVQDEAEEQEPEVKEAEATDATDAPATPVDSHEKMARKILVAVKTIDPEELARTVGTIATCLLAVVAALKIRFARSMTLGTAIGNVISAPALRYGTPFLKKRIADEDFWKWIDPVVTYSCRMCAMTMAFLLMNTIAAIHSAVQGGQLFTTYLCRYLRKYNISTFDPDTSNLDEHAGYVLAAAGLFWQLFYSTPIMLSLALLPITITERILNAALALAA